MRPGRVAVLILVWLFGGACDRSGSAARADPPHRAADPAPAGRTPPPPPGHAQPAPAPEPAPAPAPPAAPAPPTGPSGERGPIDPAGDAEWIQRMATAEIQQLRRNSGGRSVMLRLTFADGRRAVWKPEQNASGGSATNFASEIAAYHLDRILGLHRVAPVAGRSIGLSRLRAAMRNDPEFTGRLGREVIARHGEVRGATIAWLDGTLGAAQPPSQWTAWTRGRPVPPQHLERVREWTDMVLFDVLVDNTDRWSGGNIRTLGVGGPLIFLDNGAGFNQWRAEHDRVATDMLQFLCRFRRSTIETLEAMGPAAPPERRLGTRLRAAIARDALGADLLDDVHYRAIDFRVGRILEHVARCRTRFGADRVTDI